MTAEMHKIFVAQKSYCACRVLSLATIRSKYYFNFILKINRSRWEIFDRPSYKPLVYNNTMGWLVDSSHRMQGRKDWTAVGLPLWYPVLTTFNPLKPTVAIQVQLSVLCQTRLSRHL